MTDLNKFFRLLLFSFAVLLVSACHSHDHSEHDHADHSGHDHGDEAHDSHDSQNGHGSSAAAAGVDEVGNKIIRLTKLQYKNAEIDTGWFEMKNLSDVIHANGFTKLDPQDQAELSLPVDGTIKSIKVIEGNYVKKGQILATMMSLDYNEKVLERAEFEEELAICEARISFLQKKYNREKSLFDQDIVSKKDLEEVAADLDLEMAKRSSIERQIQMSSQTIATFGGEASGFLPIKAPISGHITELDLKIGETVQAGKPIISIVDNSKMHVDLMVYAKDLPMIRVGQGVRFNLTNQSDQEIKGEIYNIGKSFARETKSVAVHADIEDNDANLISGMYINALIDIGTNQVSALPETAIVRAEGREFVFLWDKENNSKEEQDAVSFLRVEVKTGARQLGFVEVNPSVKIDSMDRIVLDGSYYLQSHLQKAESGGGHSH